MTKKETSIKEKLQDDLRWRAEGIVNEALRQSPQFKKAVKTTMQELVRVQRLAVKTVKNKK